MIGTLRSHVCVRITLIGYAHGRGGGREDEFGGIERQQEGLGSNLVGDGRCRQLGGFDAMGRRGRRRDGGGSHFGEFPLRVLLRE